MNSNQEKFRYLFYWVIIFVVAGSMIIYGLSKPIQFQSFKDSTNLNVSEGHKLMWTFYSYSLIYPIIIGIFEVLGGILLLFNRTRVLGCILLTVILSNIILQDYIYEITALNSAIYYQILILILLVFDHKKIKNTINEILRSEKLNRNLTLMIVAFVIAIALKYFETKII